MTMKQALLLGVLMLPSAAALGEVTDNRNWTETYPVTAATPRLSIDNIWGSVRVRPGPEGQITVSVDEQRRAPDQALFDRSLELLKVDTYSDAAGVSITVGERDRWQGRNHCRNCRVDVQFDVVVPASSIVDVGTVLDGVIDVAGISGSVSASNVNGPIRVEADGCSEVNSVNGPVTLNFSSAPSEACDIETVNGDVTLGLPGDSGLNVALDTMNGDIVSDFDADPYALTPQVDYEAVDGRNQYRIHQSAGLRLAGGGPLFRISSLNGDVRFRKL